MWIPFQDMPGSSRIWIFQGDRPIATEEINKLEPLVKSFIDEWTSHQSTVRASFNIQYHQFIIIAVDETQVGPSGCSIDKLFRFVQSMESVLGFSLLSKNKIALMKENAIITYNLPEFKNKVKQGEIHPQDQYFDLMVQDKNGLNTEWIKPVTSGWVAKYCLN